MTLTISATDSGSGMDVVQWRIDGQPVQTRTGASASLTISTEGDHDLETRGRDLAGNVSAWRLAEGPDRQHRADRHDRDPHRMAELAQRHAVRHRRAVRHRQARVQDQRRPHAAGHQRPDDQRRRRRNLHDRPPRDRRRRPGDRVRDRHAPCGHRASGEHVRGSRLGLPRHRAVAGPQRHRHRRLRRGDDAVARGRRRDSGRQPRTRRHRRRPHARDARGRHRRQSVGMAPRHRARGHHRAGQRHARGSRRLAHGRVQRDRRRL